MHLEDHMSHDSQLQKSVLAELEWEPSINAAHIGITANAGVVTLTGHVESLVQRLAAEKAARRVRGVKAVAEEIEVRLPFDRERGDEEIAAAAIERLEWDVSVPRDSVKVKVEKGWVTLSGEVEWHYQKTASEYNIRSLSGVIGVSNLITLKSRVNVSDISDDIAHALHRTWFFEPKKIKVSADGGTVHLTGSVHSWHDWQVASATAWSAPGTIAVENEIAIV